MTKTVFGWILSVFLLIPTFLAGQYRPVGTESQDMDRIFDRQGEVRFRFVEKNDSVAACLGRIVSIDRREDSLYTAYANRTEFAQLRSLGYEPAIMEMPDRKAGNIRMALAPEEMADWDRYPSYGVYVSMMQTWAESYPHICRLDTIGLSVRGRLILSLKISDSVEQEEPEPGFFYSSSIHGDELTGFVLMLRLADYLLRNYGADEEVTQLVNTMQIYINPLANPDGAYSVSNEDVSAATRYNAAYVDLNRNFPDFWKGGSGKLQPENQAMIAYMESLDLVMSVNIHGGSDVLNFPWDGFRSSSKKHADYGWWTAVSGRYVDSCRRVDPSAYRDVTSSGYIHGGDWYVVNNSRQDYVNVYRHVREQTLEMSVEKMPASSLLPSFWDINGRSLINYMKESRYGIRGTVRDSLSGEPLRVMVTVEEHDKDSSQVYSSARHGAFFRPIATGVYNLRFSAAGYADKTVRQIPVRDFEATLCDVRLSPLESVRPDTVPAVPDTLAVGYRPEPLAVRLYPNPASAQVTIEAGFPVVIRAVYNAAGLPVLPSGSWTESFSCRHTLPISTWPAGLYLVEVGDPDGKIARLKLLKQF